LSSECIFCKIVAGETPSSKVYETERVYAFHDANPQAPTHVLIVPHEHISGVSALKDEHASLVGEMMLAARNIAEQLGIGDGYRIVVNNGRKAGQSVFHLHLHLLGGRPMRWPPG
jgi:histidine triad (HIT) family protein